MTNKQLFLYVSETGQKIKTSGLTISQHSTNNILNIVTIGKLANVIVTFTGPDNKVFPKYHMTYAGKYELQETDTEPSLVQNADKLYKYTLQISQLVSSIAVLGTSAKLNVSASLYNYTTRGELVEAAVCNTIIQVNKSESSEYLDQPIANVEVDHIWEAIGEVSQASEKHSEDIEDLTDRVEDLEADVDELGTRLTTAESDIADIKAKDEEQDESISDIETKNAQQDQEISDLSDSVDDLEQSKLDKTGGEITGNLEVSGTLDAADLTGTIGSDSTLAVNGTINAVNGSTYVKYPTENNEAASKKYNDDTNATLKSQLIGAGTDTSTAPTIYGAKVLANSIKDAEQQNSFYSVSTTKNTATGLYTLSFKNYFGNVIATSEIDTPEEKIIDPNHPPYMDGDELVITFVDGTVIRVDMSALVTYNTFSDTTTIALEQDSDHNVTATLKDGAVTVEKLDTEIQEFFDDAYNAELVNSETFSDTTTTGGRVGAENHRISNENTRIANEEDRDEAENTRIYNENLRIAAEESRAGTISAIQSRLTTAEGQLDTLQGDVDTIAGEIDGIYDTLDHKANVDGYYEQMSVGYANNLISPDGVKDNPENDPSYNPYVYRTTAGAQSISDGDAELQSIRGNTQSINQLIQNGHFSTTANWLVREGVFSVTNNEATITQNTQNYNTGIGQDINLIKNHIYFISVIAYRTTQGYAIPLRVQVANGWTSAIQTKALTNNLSLNVPTRYVTTITPSANLNRVALNVGAYDPTTYFTIKLRDVEFIDLTAIYGAGNEPTAEQFMLDYPESYYEYTGEKGAILNVLPESIKTTGFNQWDEDWESGDYLVTSTGEKHTNANRIRSKNFIPVIPNKTYYCKSNYENTIVGFFDKDKKYVSSVQNEGWKVVGNSTFTTPVWCHYMVFYGNATTYGNNICFNISWSGYRNGEYEEYWEDERLLEIQSAITAEGNTGLNGVGLVYDEFTTSKYTKKFKEVNLGTLTWTYDSTHQWFYVENVGIKAPAANDQKANIICSKYQVTTRTLAVNKGIFVNTSGALGIKDSAFTDATLFKASLDGVILVYESLDTEELAQELTWTYKVSDFGTEEFKYPTGKIAIPVPNEVLYMSNLRDKLRNTYTKDESDARYAVKEGYERNLTVGTAEQLQSTTGIIESEPYTDRTAGGSTSIGDRVKEKKIIGSCVNMRQLINYSDITTTVAGVTRTKIPNCNGYHFEGTSTGPAVFQLGNPLVSGHVMLVDVSYKYAADTEEEYIRQDQTAGGFPNSKIIKTTTTFQAMYFYVPRSGEAIKCDVYLQVFDLTMMLGSVAANKIYTMETATAGSGIAVFKKWFPERNYPYSATEEMKYVDVVKKKYTGFNQWDEQWDLGGYNQTTGQGFSSTTQIRSKNRIRVFPNTKYYIELGTYNSYVFPIFYDEDENYIGTISGGVYGKSGGTPNYHNPFTTPANAYYMSFGLQPGYGTTYKNDICLSFYWSGTRTQEYQPYTEWEYQIPTGRLNGMILVDSDGNFYASGDEMTPDGTITRKYAVADLGDLTYAKHIVNNVTHWTTQVTNWHIKYRGTRGKDTRAMIPNYFYTRTDDLPGFDKSFNFIEYYTSNEFNIRDARFDSYTAAQVKEALTGTKLLYELQDAYQTTEIGTPYIETQIVDDWGTEEFVQNSISPVGHESNYLPNLRDKLQNLPANANTDGYYIVKQTGAQQTLTAYQNELPATSTLDSTKTYQLKVVNGTLSWVEEA